MLPQHIKAPMRGQLLPDRRRQEPLAAAPRTKLPNPNPLSPNQDSVNQAGRSYPSRPAWVEIDLSRLRRNFQLICQSKPPAVAFISVLKDDAYGHGAAVVAREALSAGASMLALSTVEEAMTLRDAGITAPILLLGQRQPEELETCAREKLICCLSYISSNDSTDRIEH